MATVKLEDMKSNSFKSKEIRTAPADKKVTPVVSKNAVVTSKKSLGEKFTETFLTEDMEDVKTWLFTDVIVPGIKNTILDMLGMIFFGGGNYSRGHGGRSDYGRERVSYNSYYRSDRDRDRRSEPVRGDRHNDKVDYRNIILQRREDAEKVVEEMWRRIDDYDQVSIAEMLDLMEITGKYTDNNWGWTRKSDVGIRRVSSGYLIDVAEARPLDN